MKNGTAVGGKDEAGDKADERRISRFRQWARVQLCVEGREVKERAVRTVSAAGLYPTVLRFFGRRTMRELKMETRSRSDRSNWQETSGNETAKIEQMDRRLEQQERGGQDRTEPFRNLGRNRRNR
jgi:hypothetical protein